MNNRATSPDETHIEIFKVIEGENLRQLTKLFKQIYYTGTITKLLVKIRIISAFEIHTALFSIAIHKKCGRNCFTCHPKLEINVVVCNI